MAAGQTRGSYFQSMQMLKQIASDQLIHLLESVHGKKDLVLEPDLMRPLDRIAGAKLLKDHGVDKIFKLEPNMKIQGCDQRIYLVRPRMLSMKHIADHINADKTQGSERKYKILMVPRRLYICDMVLEQEGVMGYVTIDEFCLDLIPLDEDIYSMELPEYFKTFYLENDQTWLYSVARSIMNIETIMGFVPQTHSLGSGAVKVYDMLLNIFAQEGEPTAIRNGIDHLFIIDRDVDYITPLCTQVTYEGLLDDVFGIHSGLIEFGPEVTGKDQKMKLILSSQDEVFDDIRNRHFSNVFGYLSNKARQLQTGYDKRHGLKSVKDMKQFVSNELGDLKKQHKSLVLHIGACEVILSKKTKGDFEEFLQTEHSLLEGSELKQNISYIEERINRQYNGVSTLRLMCLLSLTQGGIPAKEFKSLKTQFLQSEGFEWMLTFFNLKKLGMLTEQETSHSSTKPLGKMAAIAALPKKSNFQAVSKKLNLIPKSVEHFDLRDPTDMAYVFSGAYTPLSCKLVETILKNNGFQGIDDVIKQLSGMARSSLASRSVKGGGESNLKSSSGIVMVYFLGGCTYTEITALRFLGKQRGYKFIICTTNIINGNKLIEQVTERGS